MNLHIIFGIRTKILKFYQINWNMQHKNSEIISEIISEIRKPQNEKV